jgi:hypothetical protein
MKTSTTILGVLGACALGLVANGCLCERWTCSSTVVSEVPSPNGALVAAVADRVCGAAIGSSVVALVEIRRKEDSYTWEDTSATLVLACLGIPKLQWRHNHFSIGLTKELAECVVRKDYEWNGMAVTYDDLGGKRGPYIPSFGHW